MSTALSKRCTNCGKPITSLFSYMIELDGKENWYCYDCYHKLFDIHLKEGTENRPKVERTIKTTKTKLSKEAKSLVKIDQLIINAYYDELMNPNDIARIFDVPVSHVYSLLQKHRKKISKEIDGMLDTPSEGF